MSLREHYKHLGLRRTVARAFAGLVNRVTTFRVVDCILLEPGHLRFEPPAQTERRFLTSAEMRAVAKDPRYHFSRNTLERALASGDDCLGVFVDGELASYGLYSDAPAGVCGRTMHYDRAYRYMYSGYTLPEHRGRRLHAVGLALALRHYADRGYRGLVSCVDRTNYRSRRSCRRLGFRPCGSLVQVGRIARATRAAKAHGIRLG